MKIITNLIYILFCIAFVFSLDSCKNGTQKTTDNSNMPPPSNGQFEDRPGPPPGGGFGQKTITEFLGLKTSDTLQTGLFPIQSTGVSTEPITIAGKQFLESLSSEQLKKIQFDIQDKEWWTWSNVDNGIFKREGVSLKEMSTSQKTLAFKLMEEALSAKGLKLSKDIMKTDQTLKEMNGGSENFDEELYFFTIMGKPTLNEPWGWQLDGHHLVINYFVLGDQVVMTPTFMGGEPVITATGKHKGNTIFQDEQNYGLKLMQSFNKKQQSKATISTSKGRENMQAGAGADNITIEFEGLPAAQMSATQKEKILKLIALYVNNMKEGHAQVKMEEIKKHLDNTWFAWKGGVEDNSEFYYRILSPVILIEFDHQGPVGMRGESRNKPRNHIHTMVRTPNGNDYGKDYLKQHLKEHHKH